MPGRLLPALAPLGPVLDDPISQRAFEPDITTGFLGFDPLVLQNLLTFRLKFPIKRRVLEQLAGCNGLFRLVRHSCEHKLLRARHFNKAAGDDNPFLGNRAGQEREDTYPPGSLAATEQTGMSALLRATSLPPPAFHARPLLDRPP